MDGGGGGLARIAGGMPVSVVCDGWEAPGRFSIADFHGGRNDDDD
jgi:hypothetical protein